MGISSWSDHDSTGAGMDNAPARPAAPVFDKVWLAAIVAAVSPPLLRIVTDQLNILVDEEDVRRVVVGALTGLLTFAAAWWKTEPLRKVQAYLSSKRA